MAESSTINIEETQRASISQSNQNINAIAVEIIQQLDRVPPAILEPHIFRVHHQLRMVNKKAYEPVLLSIGPYHYSKRVSRLEYMEKHKLQYLNQHLNEVEGQTGISKDEQLNNYLVTLKELEDKARAYYAEAVTLHQHDFLKMMLLDGCFIIQLFERYRTKIFEGANEEDLLLKRAWIRCTLARDLILIENQLPFFVLEKLHTVILKQPDSLNLIISAVAFLPTYNQGLDEMHSARQCIRNLREERPISVGSRRLDRETIGDIKHLLDLVRKFMLIEETLVQKHETDQGAQQVDEIAIEEPTHAIDMLQMKYKYSATELSDSGVKFKGIEKGKFYDIKFEDGVLQIPKIQIEDNTEIIFRNLIAYEQHTHGDNFKYISDYIGFMDGLIESRKDVELFRREGIITSLMGDDEVISTMFNKMHDHVIISPEFYYKKIVRDLDKHYKKKIHTWMATLRRNYLNTPWAILSIVAASILLIITLLQTVYTTLSYYHN